MTATRVDSEDVFPEPALIAYRVYPGLGRVLELRDLRRALNQGNGPGEKNDKLTPEDLDGPPRPRSYSGGFECPVRPRSEFGRPRVRLAGMLRPSLSETRPDLVLSTRARGKMRTRPGVALFQQTGLNSQRPRP